MVKEEKAVAMTGSLVQGDPVASAAPEALAVALRSLDPVLAGSRAGQEGFSVGPQVAQRVRVRAAGGPSLAVVHRSRKTIGDDEE